MSQSLFPFLLPTSALKKKQINENPKPLPFFLSLFFSSFRLDFIQSLSRLEFTDGVPFDTAPEKNTAHETKEALCERAKKRSFFFARG